MVCYLDEVHLTLGSRRVFGQVLRLGFFRSDGVPLPAPAQVTHTVGPRVDTYSKLEAHVRRHYARYLETH